MLVSDYLMNALGNHIFRNSAYSSPSAVYLALLTGVPLRQTATPASEVVEASYARQAITFGAWAAGRGLNSAAVTFATPLTDWTPANTPVVAIAIMDALTSGNWLVAEVICPRMIYAYSVPPIFAVKSIKVFLDGALSSI